MAESALTENLSDALEQAGALVTSITKLRQPFVHLRPGTAKNIRAELDIELAEGQDLRSLLATRLAEQLVQGLPEIPWRLAHAGLIERSGNYEVPVDCVVLLTGPERLDSVAVEKIDLPLVMACRQVNVRVIACEPKDTPNSMMAFFRRQNIPTVDNVDTLPGELALALAIAGKNGNYGVKETADELLPALEATAPAPPPSRR